MPFSHATGVYNVQSSVIAWLQAQITANPPPATGALPLVIDHPDQPLQLPEVSVCFLPVGPDPVPLLGGQVGGGLVGARRFGQIEIDCWVSRQEANWRAQLLQMQDTITKSLLALRAAGNSLPVYDFYTNAAAPAALAYRVFIGDIDSRRVPVEAKTSVERQRIVIAYWWVERN